MDLDDKVYQAEFKKPKEERATWGCGDKASISSKVPSTLFCWLFSIKFFLLVVACAISLTSMQDWFTLHWLVEQYYWLSFPAYGIYVILWYVLQHSRAGRTIPLNGLLVLSTMTIAMSFIFAASPTFTWFKPYPYIVLFSLATSATIYCVIISPFLWYP